MTKDDVARRLAEWHFEVDSAITVIFRILGPNEDAPDEPIKLLELSEGAFRSGRFDAFHFTPTTEVPFPTVIAQVAPDELDELRAKGEIPTWWNLEGAQRFDRPKAA